MGLLSKNCFLTNSLILSCTFLVVISWFVFFFLLLIFCLQEGNLLHVCKNVDTWALNFMAFIF